VQVLSVAAENSLRCCLVQVLNVAVERMLLISSCYEY
jgi:hypothetical protein